MRILLLWWVHHIIDELEAQLKAGCDLSDAPKLLATLIAVLLFVDDIALMSYSPSGLQHQLSILDKFCADQGLTLNVNKTKIVTFQPGSIECQAFNFQGQVIESVDVLRYLGIAFHATRGLSCTMEQLCNSARTSWSVWTVSRDAYIMPGAETHPVLCTCAPCSVIAL